MRSREPCNGASTVRMHSRMDLRGQTETLPGYDRRIARADPESYGVGATWLHVTAGAFCIGVHSADRRRERPKGRIWVVSQERSCPI